MVVVVVWYTHDDKLRKHNITLMKSWMRMYKYQHLRAGGNSLNGMLCWLDLVNIDRNGCDTNQRAPQIALPVVRMVRRTMSMVVWRSFEKMTVAWCLHPSYGSNMLVLAYNKRCPVVRCWLDGTNASIAAMMPHSIHIELAKHANTPYIQGNGTTLNRSKPQKKHYLDDGDHSDDNTLKG